MVALIGALATLLPWYISDLYSFNGQYLNLFSGLFEVNNLGLEFAALIFYPGLLMVSYKGKGWSLSGGLIMGLAAMMSSLSIQGLPVWGAGLYVELIVILYAFLPILDLFMTL
jgi:hypothetical protein